MAVLAVLLNSSHTLDWSKFFSVEVTCDRMEENVQIGPSHSGVVGTIACLDFFVPCLNSRGN